MVELTNTPSEIYQGAAALKIPTTSTGLGQFIRGLTVGNTYTLSAHCKQTNINDTTYIGVTFYDENETKLSEVSYELPHQTVYTLSANNFKVPINTFRISLWLWKQTIGKGVVLVDNIDISSLITETENKINTSARATVYPNPVKANQKVIVEIPANLKNQIVSLEINDLMAKGVFSSKLKANDVVDFVVPNNLGAGLYTVKVSGSSGSVTSKFLITE